MMRKGPRIIFLTLFFMMISSLLCAESLDEADYRPFPGIIKTLAEGMMPPGQSIEGKEITVDRPGFRAVLEYARQEGYSLFELLNLSGLAARELGMRILVPGDVFRTFDKEYDLGGEKIHIVFPFQAVEKISFGAELQKGDNALDVYLQRKFTNDFYGFGKLHEERHFGFSGIKLNEFTDGFGMRATKLFFSFPMDRIHLYGEELVAFYLKGFPKPKREVFWKIVK